MTDHLDALARAFLPQRAQDREQRVHGLVTAKVDRIEDDGTYRLRMHGMNGQEDDDISAKARVMMPMAGSKRGFHFFPEPGDEVVVGFLVGDTNNPIIIGAAWNSDDKPPDQAHESPENNIRTMVSRSGHEFTFDDTKGAEKLTIKTNGGHQVVLDDNPAAPTVTVSSNGGRSVVLDDTPPGKVTIAGTSCQITMIDGVGSISIQATASIELSAPTITLAATTLALGAGPGSCQVDGSPYHLHTHYDPPVHVPMTGPVVP